MLTCLHILSENKFNFLCHQLVVEQSSSLWTFFAEPWKFQVIPNLHHFKKTRCNFFLRPVTARILWLLWILVTLMIKKAEAEEGGNGMDSYSSSLNAVPRMGRRSLNPFQRNHPQGTGTFRFFRPRRFSNPLFSHGFRYQDGPADNSQAINKHKRTKVEEDGEWEMKLAMGPHPLQFARPTFADTGDKTLWDTLISDKTRQANLQKMVSQYFGLNQEVRSGIGFVGWGCCKDWLHEFLERVWAGTVIPTQQCPKLWRFISFGQVFVKLLARIPSLVKNLPKQILWWSMFLTTWGDSKAVKVINLPDKYFTK